MHISDITFLPQMLGNGKHNVCWCYLGIDVTCDSVAHDLRRDKLKKQTIW
jgi:hypothetical protein